MTQNETTAGAGPTHVDVAANLECVRAQIGQACARSGRSVDDVELIAVSKAQPIERIEAALDAGQRVFGENYVQESAARWPQLRARYSGCDVHMIGPLQTNKVRQAVEIFDCVQSVDRFKLATALAKEMERAGRRLRLFCQVNTGEEPQKAGVLPRETDAFIAQCREELGLEFEGLMAIPPVDDELALHVELLAKVARRNGLAGLSIGMSSDFEVATEFGATHVRVGSAIFGSRPAKTAA